MRSSSLFVAVLVFPVGRTAVAQTVYPDRPIKMIIPLAAASAVDVAARIMTQKLADNMRGVGRSLPQRFLTSLKVCF